MSENKKPRLCEVLGVEPDEEFKIKDDYGEMFRINKNGHREYRLNESTRWNLADFETRLIHIINNPELIIRGPFIEFTDDEKAVLRLLKKGGVTTITKNTEAIYYSKGDGRVAVTSLGYFILPSLAEGQTIVLSAMDLGEET